MRSAVCLVVAITACTSPPAPGGDDAEPVESGRRYISVGADALETVRAIAPFELVEQNADVAVIAFDAKDFRALSEAMHDKHNRCGGFMLHDSVDEARTALRAGDNERIKNLAVSYALDSGPTVEAVLPSLDKARILGTIEDLSANQNRYYTSATGAAVSTWLRDLWQSFTSRSDVTVELVDHGFAQKSVILTIPGSTLADEVVVIGGHLDSIAPGGSTSTAPGADDDASGIATITEVARVLLAQDYRPARTIKVMAYAAEEVGLRGSQAIVTDHQNRGVNVVGVMQLDMTNYQGSDKDIWLMQDYTNAAQNTFVTEVIDAYVGATWGTDSCGYGCSDHASWHDAGFPASMPFESRMSEYNPNIHTPDDTLEVSDNNADHAIKFARLGAAFLVELGEGQLGASDNTAPTVSISAPTTGASFPVGTSVQLTATANDAEDGNLTTSIAWTSSRDGSLGSGGSRSVTLSAGSHTITATVKDSKNATTQKSVTVDVAQAGGALFSDDFEGSTAWTKSGLWHSATSSSCAPPGYASATHAMYYGADASCTYATGARTTGSMTSPAITGVTASSTLRFKHFRKVEQASGAYDIASVEVLIGTTPTTVFSQSSTTASQAAWIDSGAISLSQFAGQSIRLRFTFDSKDSAENSFTGWLVDDVVVSQ